MATSRLIVRNLAPSADEKQLRSHFSKHGEITDVKIMKNQGKSRCFAFVGFRSDSAAQGAKESMDRSYIGSTRINVDYAQVRGNQSAKGKAAPPPKISLKQDSKSSQKSKNIDSNSGGDGTISKKNDMKDEFISAMKRTSATCWSNEEELSSKMARKEPVNNDDSSSDDGSDNEMIDIIPKTTTSNDGTTAPSSSNPAANKALSDLNYLKVKSNLASFVPSDCENEEIEKDVPEVKSKLFKVKQAKKVMVVGEEGATGNEHEVSVRGKEEEEDKGGKEADEVHAMQDDAQSNRLFIRNLPYSVEESELKSLFNKAGNVSDVFIPVDELKRQKGFAFISYNSSAEAQAAQETLKEVIFQGRPLYISTAVAKDQHASSTTTPGVDPMSKDELSKLKTNGAYKQWKELERRKKAMETEGWNASHVRSDAVVDVITSRLNVNKSDFLDVNENNMAVRLAIGETHIIAENVDYFEKEGIDLNTLISENSNDNKRSQRSDRVILIKNIPSSTDALELSNLFSKFGELERFLLPPSKLVALVEFVDSKEAKNAFKGLAYKRYQNVPLYLEWAPQDAIGARRLKQKKRAHNSDDSDDSGEEEEEEEEKNQNKKLKSSFLSDDDPSNYINDENTSIYVKNLSFQTKEQDLKQLFSQAHQSIIVRNVFIPKNKSKIATGVGSLGYGFVEFGDQASVELALNKLQGVVLDGKTLELKRSQKKLSTTTAVTSKSSTTTNASSPTKKLKQNNTEQKQKLDDDEEEDNPTRTKLLVKNVAFQTSIQEMRELFSTFGTLKSLSMPKKYDGRHRGFAFVDYVLAHEASAAKKQLSSSHFYGRHLIIQWANDDSNNNADNTISSGMNSSSSGGGNNKDKALEKIRNKARKTVNASKIIAGMTTKKQMNDDGFDEFTKGAPADDED